LERGKRIELSALAWKAKVLPLYEPRINIFMHTYDAITKCGLHIHLSMSTNNTCYILVYDTFTQQMSFKFFTTVETALEFIRSIES
jgi:hypothetical protein